MWHGSNFIGVLNQIESSLKWNLILEEFLSGNYCRIRICRLPCGGIGLGGLASNINSNLTTETMPRSYTESTGSSLHRGQKQEPATLGKADEKLEYEG